MLTQKELTEAIEKGRDALESKGGRISLQLKAATDTIVSPNPGGYVLDPDTPAPSGDSVLLRTLIPNIPVSGSGAVTYFKFSQVGSPGEVVEDAQKPQFNAGITSSTLPLVQVAGIEKISEEVLDDVPQLIRTAEQFAKASKDNAALRRVLMGAGSISGIFFNTSIPVSSVVQGAAQEYTTIMAAIEAVHARGFSPNAIVTAANTATAILQRARMSFELTYQTSGSLPQATTPTDVGSPLGLNLFSFAPAFGAIRMHIAGLPLIVLSGAVPQGARGQILIGDFARGAAIYTAGEKLEIGRDADDFSRDRYTLRVSERLNVAVKNSAAFQFASTNVL